MLVAAELRDRAFPRSLPLPRAVWAPPFVLRVLEALTTTGCRDNLDHERCGIVLSDIQKIVPTNHEFMCWRAHQLNVLRDLLEGSIVSTGARSGVSVAWGCRYELLGDCVLKTAACMHLMRTESQSKSEGHMTVMLHGLGRAA